jgi:hypothetical protein
MAAQPCRVSPRSSRQLDLRHRRPRREFADDHVLPHRQARLGEKRLLERQQLRYQLGQKRAQVRIGQRWQGSHRRILQFLYRGAR